MFIEKLRIVDNDGIDTDEGRLVAPTTYYMDVALNEEETVAVPIDATAYKALHNLFTIDEVPVPAGYTPTNPGFNLEIKTA